VGLFAIDPEGDALTQWANQLPPGASFDPINNVFTWTPTYAQAGVYNGITLAVSDGVNTLTPTFNVTVQPKNAAPTLKPVANHTITEGDTLQFRLNGSDFDGDALTYFSPILPGGAFLDPNTGDFHWTPGYAQAGTYDISFRVTDGTSTAEVKTTLTVLNANGAPVFDELGSWDIVEGQPFSLQVFAFDPDNPGFIPRIRGMNGGLSEQEGSNPTVTYALSGLPAGATFDPDTLLLSWVPGATQAGTYTITVTATDRASLATRRLVSVTRRRTTRGVERQVLYETGANSKTPRVLPSENSTVTGLSAKSPPPA
jgi:hypothetical protein